MTAIVTSNFRVVNAENFKEDVASAGTSIYVGIGKPDVWSLTLSDTTDTTPFVPVDALDSLGEAHQNLIGMKLIGSSDISHVVPRYTWTASRVYIAWDSDDAAMFDKEFYIVTSEFKVYKCIKAGASGSSIQPTQTLTAPTGESDGYVWKYMYTVSVADAEKFLTTSYLSNNLAIHLSVSIIFNIIKSKAFLIRSASYNLCHNHKWPIKAAKQNGVTCLRMTNYNSHE